jgi:hypothetical protein
MQKDPHRRVFLRSQREDRLEKRPNAGDVRSRAVEALVLTAAGAAELALTVEPVLVVEPVSIRAGEMAGTEAEELAAP